MLTALVLDSVLVQVLVQGMARDQNQAQGTDRDLVVDMDLDLDMDPTDQGHQAFSKPIYNVFSNS